MAMHDTRCPLGKRYTRTYFFFKPQNAVGKKVVTDVFAVSLCQTDGGAGDVQFRVDDCDAWVKKLNAVGYETIWSDRLRPDIAYAYLERPGDPLLVEFLEYPLGGDAKEPLPE